MTSDAFLLTPEMVSCLPRRFQPVAELIGLEKTSALIHEYAGIQLYVGTKRKMRDQQLLEDTIGPEAFARLSGEYGGKLIHIPQIAVILQRRRHALIRERFLAGVDAEELAIEFDLSNRTVYQIVRSVRGNIPRCLPVRPLTDIRMKDYGGESPAEFAQKHGITSRYAMKILRRHGVFFSEIRREQRLRQEAALVKEYKGEPVMVFANKMGISHHLAENVAFIYHLRQGGLQLPKLMAALLEEYRGEPANAFAGKMGISLHKANRIAFICRVKHAGQTAEHNDQF